MAGVDRRVARSSSMRTPAWPSDQPGMAHDHVEASANLHVEQRLRGDVGVVGDPDPGRQARPAATHRSVQRRQPLPPHPLTGRPTNSDGAHDQHRPHRQNARTTSARSGNSAWPIYRNTTTKLPTKDRPELPRAAEDHHHQGKRRHVPGQADDQEDRPPITPGEAATGAEAARR